MEKEITTAVGRENTANESDDMKNGDFEKCTEDPVLNVGGVGPTHRLLKGYQVTMIGFCSGIGTGFFVGTGAAYAKAGPGGLLLAYMVMAVIMWSVVQSICEIAAFLPVAGSFPHWTSRFIDPALGFSLAITYGYSYTIGIATECSAAAIIVSYWTNLSPAVVITVGLALILIINLASVRWFGEAETFAGAAKILCFIIIIITSIIITAGGAPDRDPIGFRYWRNPGAWTNFDGIPGSTGHFLGFLSAFVNAAFTFMGSETVALTAAESINPHRAIPRAARHVAVRISFFYITGAILTGLIVNPNNPMLVSGSHNANSSPFVVAIKTAGIPVLPSFINALILTSAWSAGNSYCWVGSRIIVAMTTDRQLPQIFGRVTARGVPYWAVIASFLFGPFAYLSLGSGGASQTFGWLQNIAASCGLIAWSTLSLCYIRFHAALKVQGISRDTLPWKSPFQPYTAWVGFIGPAVVCLICGFPVFLKDHWSTSDFVAAYISIPVFIIPILVWKIYHRTQIVKLNEIDLWNGRLEPRAAEIAAETSRSWWGRAMHTGKRLGVGSVA